MIDEAMVLAWREAARDLGIRVVAPFPVRRADGSVIWAEAHIADFGSRKGAIALSFANPASTTDFDIWASRLYEPYRTYRRQLFIETLDDWAWYGAGEPPDWYGGRPWGG
jgi:hypothetical protein